MAITVQGSKTEYKLGLGRHRLYIRLRRISNAGSRHKILAATTGANDHQTFALSRNCSSGKWLVPPSRYRADAEAVCTRHPTQPQLIVPPSRAPRRQSPGLRQPLPLPARARSLSPYLRLYPPVPSHLRRTVKLRLEPTVAARPVSRSYKLPQRRERSNSPRRHFGELFHSTEIITATPPTDTPVRPKNPSTLRRDARRKAAYIKKLKQKKRKNAKTRRK
ncbi:unnamed protein product [Trichogramma brassicae]|uniref:Uncharacterized protein n=1 Tax=Trichogramma brassicae TaxID=86971 RepID=A0A6H5IT20_9HYME|nr:unnamed protein product [Trichogramma brassicae]